MHGVHGVHGKGGSGRMGRTECSKAIARCPAQCGGLLVRGSCCRTLLLPAGARPTQQPASAAATAQASTSNTLQRQPAHAHLPRTQTRWPPPLASAAQIGPGSHQGRRPPACCRRAAAAAAARAGCGAAAAPAAAARAAVAPPGCGQRAHTDAHAKAVSVHHRQGFARLSNPTAGARVGGFGRANLLPSGHCERGKHAPACGRTA
jgi:hypothetical protein